MKRNQAQIRHESHTLISASQTETERNQVPTQFGRPQLSLVAVCFVGLSVSSALASGPSFSGFRGRSTGQPAVQHSINTQIPASPYPQGVSLTNESRSGTSGEAQPSTLQETSTDRILNQKVPIVRNPLEIVGKSDQLRLAGLIRSAHVCNRVLSREHLSRFAARASQSRQSANTLVNQLAIQHQLSQYESQALKNAVNTNSVSGSQACAPELSEAQRNEAVLAALKRDIIRTQLQAQSKAKDDHDRNIASALRSLQQQAAMQARALPHRNPRLPASVSTRLSSDGMQGPPEDRLMNSRIQYVEP